jgi:outer membrane receptor protein involved in Fe transport
VNASATALARCARAAGTLLLLAELSATEPVLEAQSLPTATLAGKVTAEDGTGLPGITIRLESVSLQGVREISTSATGDFLAALLPAGEYTVTFQAEGMQSVSRSVTLRAASTVRLDQPMRPAGVAESVEVAAEAAPAAALTRPEIQASYKKQVIDRLPVDRSLRSVVLLAPGVTENGARGNVGTTNDRKGLMLSGAFSYSSLFLINGVVVNENLGGQPYDLFIEDAIDETTVSTGNISAEYGRFTGGVVNAITRSGGNELKGSFRVTLHNDRWTANNPFDRARGDDNRVDHVTESYEETLGGPAWKDRIWLFAAARQAKLSDSRETRVIPRPGDLDPTPTAYVHSTDEQRIEGKLTASLFRGHTLVASYIDVDFDERNTALDPTLLLDTAGLVSREAPYSLLAINSSGVLSSRLFLEAQYSRRRFSSSALGAIDSDPVLGSLILDESRGLAGYNSPRLVTREPELYDNDSYSLKGVYFLPTSSAGIHEIHSGYERFSESARRNFRRSGSDFWINGSTTILRGTSIFPTFRPGRTRIEWYPIVEPSRGSELVTNSGFLEDRLQLGRHWSFNLGVRYDRNRDRDGRGELVSNSGAWSPRLSFRFDPKGDGRWEVHGGYARYVDKLHDTIVNATSSAGSLVWNYEGPSCVNCDTFAPTGALLSTEQALRILFDWFNGIGGTASTPTGRGLVAGVVKIAPGLKPQSSRDYSAGAGVALGARGFLRADFLHREYRDLYASRIDLSTGQSQSAFGTVHDLALVGNSDTPERRYTAIHAQFSWRLGQSLQAAGSYAWSRLTSNSREGGAISAMLAPFEYPEYSEERWSFPMGYLSARGAAQGAVDQRHRASVWLVYRRPTGWGDLSASVLESYDSGFPYEAIGLLDPRPYVENPGYVQPPDSVRYFFTKPGSFRTDDITRTDLALTCSIRVFRDVEVFVRPEVLNLFNEKGVVAVDRTVLTARNSTRFQTFNPFTEEPVRGVHYDVAPTFGKPAGAADYQIPRTFRVSTGVRF